MNQVQIEDRIKDLKKFGFDEFCDRHGILDDMIDELPAYLVVVNATPDDFWGEVDGAAKYDEKLTEKQESDDPEIAAKFAGKTWKDDHFGSCGRPTITSSLTFQLQHAWLHLCRLRVLLWSVCSVK